MSGPNHSSYYQPGDVGRFGIGLWHQKPGTPPLDWHAIGVGSALGPFDWLMEPYEVAILCFCAELHEAAYLPRAAEPLPVVPPVAAVWASFSLLQGHVALGAIVDVSHETRWHRRLRAGEATILSGRIAEKYEKRGRHYLVWETSCRPRGGGEEIFDVRHTILDLTAAGPK